MIGTYPQEKFTIVVLSNSGNAGTVESAVTRKVFERLPALRAAEGNSRKR